MSYQKSGHTNILWTGGWDSTFRIVQLARAGKEVQPHYIADHSRASISKEISVMHEARQTINHRFRGAHIREVYVQDLSRIRIYDDFSAAYQSLRSRGWIGSQYKYIASYARMKGIKRLDLSIERGNQGENSRTNIPRAENTAMDQHGRRVISSKVPEDLRTLFGSFSFPIVELTNYNMRELARGAARHPESDLVLPPAFPGPAMWFLQSLYAYLRSRAGIPVYRPVTCQVPGEKNNHGLPASPQITQPDQVWAPILLTLPGATTGAPLTPMITTGKVNRQPLSPP